MRQEIAEIVHPVLEAGLALKDKLVRGIPLEFEIEQSHLRRLLLSKESALRLPAYGGDTEGFYGIRYALVCWLDEIFSVDPNARHDSQFDSKTEYGRETATQRVQREWRDKWESKLLEYELYGTRDRYYIFVQQANIAASFTEGDALEGYYLCTMLGFRGQYRDDPQLLAEFREKADTQLKAAQSRQWKDKPPELLAESNVPALTGRDRLRRASKLAVISVAPVLLVGAFLYANIAHGGGSQPTPSKKAKSTLPAKP